MLSSIQAIKFPFIDYFKACLLVYYESVLKACRKVLLIINCMFILGQNIKVAKNP